MISSLKEYLKLVLQKKIGLSLKNDFWAEVKIEMPEQESFGDYSTNIAFCLAPLLKKDPSKIADCLVKELKNLSQLSLFFSEIKNIKGFINFYLSPAFIEKELNKILREKTNYGRGEPKKKTLVIDYSSPNIARAFGVGHLRSTIVGQTLYNLYQFLGWRCIGDNHLGDWGTQFGVLIYQIEKLIEGKNIVQQKRILSRLTIKDLERLYVDFHRQLQDKPQLQEEARKCFQQLEQGEKQALKIWKFCLRLSKREFTKIYRLLGIRFDYSLGESFYRKRALLVFQEIKKKNLVKKSQGAFILEFPKTDLPPAILLKSDGTTTYFLRDLAAIEYRLKRWAPALIIYEVGVDQVLYFKQLFAAVKILGWDKETQFVHLAHGLLRDTTGKFSTRRGKIIHLEEVIKQATKKAATVLANSSIIHQISFAEKEKIIRSVAIGAIKYNILSYHYTREIIFDWDKMINFKGNSGPYLQYTYVRCLSVLNKAKERKIKQSKKIVFELEKLDLLEQNLGKILVKFPEIVQRAAETFSTNILCDYLYKLAAAYNVFYQQDPIINSASPEIRNRRILLTKTTLFVLGRGLALLGLPILTRM